MSVKTIIVDTLILTKRLKAIPIGAAHIYIAHIRENFLPPKSPELLKGHCYDKAHVRS